MEMNVNTNTASMEAIITTVQESAVNGRKATLYQVESPLTPIYIVQYENKDNELETEVSASKDKANKRYMAAIKSMLKD